MNIRATARKYKQITRGERELRRATILIEMDQLVRKSQSKLATADLSSWFLLCRPHRMRVSHSGIDGPDEDVSRPLLHLKLYLMVRTLLIVQIDPTHPPRVINHGDRLHDSLQSRRRFPVAAQHWLPHGVMNGAETRRNFVVHPGLC